jgi:hypothetical protein
VFFDSFLQCRGGEENRNTPERTDQLFALALKRVFSDITEAQISLITETMHERLKELKLTC